MDVKGPALPSYAEHYGDKPVPESVFSDWGTTNVQIITGTAHAGPLKLAVVDLDGDEAQDKWRAICAANGYRAKSAWIAKTGSGGTHFYYSLPDGSGPIQGGLLWGLWDTFGANGKGQWAKHREIRLLANNALVVAPPSIHVETGKRYAFLPGFGPNEIETPEAIPDWIVNMPRLVAPVTRPITKRPTLPGRPLEGSWKRSYSRAAVLASIPDKIALVRSWGLLMDREAPNPNGWVSCYVPGREDPNHGSRPSGSFHHEDGTFQDRKDLSTISLFDLGAILQPAAFPRWYDCLHWCGERYLG